MTAPQLPAPAAAIEEAAQAYVDGLALRDSLSPEDAARAAGARTPAEVERIAGLIRAQRSHVGAA